MVKCDVCTIGNRVERLVRYHLDIEDTLVVVDHVPAVVCDHCGETTFAPGIAARLQKTVWARDTPARTIEAHVYEFSR